MADNDFGVTVNSFEKMMKTKDRPGRASSGSLAMDGGLHGLSLISKKKKLLGQQDLTANCLKAFVRMLRRDSSEVSPQGQTSEGGGRAGGRWLRPRGTPESSPRRARHGHSP